MHGRPLEGTAILMPLQDGWTFLQTPSIWLRKDLTCKPQVPALQKWNIKRWRFVRLIEGHTTSDWGTAVLESKPPLWHGLRTFWGRIIIVWVCPAHDSTFTIPTPFSPTLNPQKQLQSMVTTQNVSTHVQRHPGEVAPCPGWKAPDILSHSQPSFTLLATAF